VSRFLPTEPYRGTRDFLPAEMSIRQQVFDQLYGVVERYGYLRYDGPLLESAEIYEAKSGREIADLQLYTLTDRGGRRLALRPEMTPSVARMVARNANALQFPIRWYCNVNCHRYERPQRGRTREHWQVNVDIFGSESPACEIEMFELIHDIMASVGATRDMYVLRVSDRVLLDGILTKIVGLDRDKIRPASSLLDRWEKYPRETLAAEAGKLGISERQFTRLEAVVQSDDEIINELPADLQDKSPVANLLAAGSDGMFSFDPLIVRGFEYYTSTVFEVFDRDPANNRSLFGGGRYSDLVGLFSARQVPGIGFAIGDVTLFDFLATHELLPEAEPEVDVAVIPTSPEMQVEARSVARMLRAAGLRTSTPLELRKVGREIARAANAGASAVIILGPDDWRDGNVTVRDLKSGEQRTVPKQESVTTTRSSSRTPKARTATVRDR
jgi:histidyl-tRNA synthetase